MKDALKKRPSSVALIGWSFILLAIVTILSGIISLWAVGYMKQMTGVRLDLPPQLSEGMPESLRIIFVILLGSEPLVILQIAGAIFMLIASIYFLKLRSWARAALEFLCWLGILFTSGFSVFWIFLWTNMASSMRPAGIVPAPIPMSGIMGSIIGILLAALGIIPLIVAIKYLRGHEIREAVT